MSDRSVCFGVSIASIELKETPVFSTKETFFAISPVLVNEKATTDKKENHKHLTYEDNASSECLTRTMKWKLRQAGIPDDGVRVYFDKLMQQPRTKIVEYDRTKYRVNFCPVTVEGTPEQVAFAWNVGVGNSTGIIRGVEMKKNCNSMEVKKLNLSKNVLPLSKI
jgi:CRISPR-associated endoribonuclease Cas6